MYNDLNQNIEILPDKHGCSAVGAQHVNVNVPVTVKPFGEIGNAKVHCLGRPIVKDSEPCHGEPGGVCRFTISQKMRVEVPVTFHAKAESNGAFVDCGCAESKGGCILGLSGDRDV